VPAQPFARAGVVDQQVHALATIAIVTDRVEINPDDGQFAIDLLDSSNGFELEPTPVSVELPEVVT